MNTDCLFAIAQFAGPKQATQMKRDFTKEFLPKSITIVGHKEMEEFYDWSKRFDTSNLTEVRIVIHDEKLIESMRTYYPKAPRADGLVVASPIGLVPPSVKKLTISVWTDEKIQISDTVEELVIETAGFDGLYIPDSVRTLHLMDAFHGHISHWPENLESLCINGWCSGNGLMPIYDIPDTVKELILGSHLDIEIMHWPESLETLVLEGTPEDYGWSLDRDILPDGVEVFVKKVPWNVAWVEDLVNDYENPAVESL